MPADSTQKRRLEDEVFARANQRQEPIHVPTKASLVQQSKLQDLSLAIPRLKRKERTEAESDSVVHPSRKAFSSVKDALGTVLIIQHKPPWDSVKRLGTLIQGETKLVLCAPKEDFRDMVMFKELEKTAGEKEIEALKKLPHPNIIKLRTAFLNDNIIYLGFEYCRHTLEELLYVHIALQESHLKLITKSVFDAVEYMAKVGRVHSDISLESIRISTRTGNLLLTNFDRSFDNKEITMPNTDLEALAVVVIECMNERPFQSGTRQHHLHQVRTQRSKVFGIDNAERWSGCKQLIDFLDELLNVAKPAMAKFERPHTFITEGVPHPKSLIPFLELIPMECFMHWQPAGNGSSQ